MFADGIAAVLPHARAAKVPLALEPMHPMYAADRGCITTINEMTDLCDELGDGLGIAVDTYHVWWDPNLGREIGAHEVECIRSVGRIGHRLRRHGSDAGLGPRNDRADREPVRLHRDSKLTRRRVTRNDRVRHPTSA